MYVLEKGLMNGTAEDEFNPDMTLTRAMIVMILYNHSGKPDVSGVNNPFNDAADGRWYRDAVIWAADNDIVQGYGDGIFGVEDPVTRQDLSVILLRYMKLLGVSLPVTQQYVMFADDADIAGYASAAVQTLNILGVIRGTGTDESGRIIINPAGEATRAEAAAMLHRFIEAISAAG